MWRLSPRPRSLSRLGTCKRRTRVLLAQAETTTPSDPAQAPAATPAPVPAPATVSPPSAAQAQPPAPAAPPDDVAAAPQAQPSETYSRAEIEKLVAPIALYPDALLAQLLAATAYPLDIVQAARWLDRNKAAVERRDFSGIDNQRWDESVKALARFPEVIRKLNDDVDWTTDLGEAFINQPKDVADAIQDLRDRAEAKGALNTTEEQRVVRRQEGGRNVVIIEPVNPHKIYVPRYDPWALWWPTPGYVFAGPWLTFPYYGLLAGVVPAAFYWGWNSGWIYPPYWPGYRGWRPGLGHPYGDVRWRPNPIRFKPHLVSKRSDVAARHNIQTNRRMQNISHEARRDRATRELTRAGGRSQQMSKQTRQRDMSGRTSTRGSMNAQQRRMTRQDTRMDRRMTRQGTRMDRRMTRQDMRMDRRITRQNTRMDRQMTRQTMRMNRGFSSGGQSTRSMGRGTSSGGRSGGGHGYR